MVTLAFFFQNNPLYASHWIFFVKKSVKFQPKEKRTVALKTRIQWSPPPNKFVRSKHWKMMEIRRRNIYFSLNCTKKTETPWRKIARKRNIDTRDVSKSGEIPSGAWSNLAKICNRIPIFLIFLEVEILQQLVAGGGGKARKRRQGDSVLPARWDGF
jgi:hypothetical protein